MKTFFTQSVKLITLLVLSFFSFSIAVAQTAPVITPQYGFGIDGDLKANTPTQDIGDWIPATDPGLGQNVFDLNGTALNPATTYRFTDLYNSTNDDTFSSGKFYQNPNTDWSWTTSKAVGKGDINNVLIHLGVDTSDNQWLIIASDRLENTGSSYIDFEFFQKKLTANSNGSFTLDGGNRTIDDILLAVEYTNGGSTATVKFYRWNGTSYVLVVAPGVTAYGKTNTGVINTMTGGAFGSSQYTLPQQFV